jgi:ribosomal protein L37AE/L43A
MSEHEYLFEQVAMLGQCPDCHSVKLEGNGTYAHCKACHSMFATGSFYVRRVKPPANFFKTGQVISLEQ